MVVYLVRSFRTYARIRSLTTGTFNLVVKDRIAFRLSGAHPGLDGPAFLGRTQQERIRLSSKPFKHIVRAQPCQRMRPTAFPRDFHMGNMRSTRGPGELNTQKPCHSYLQAYRQALSFRAALPRGICFWGAQQHATISPSASNQKTPMNRRTPNRRTEN